MPFLGPPKNPQKVKKRPPKWPFFDPPEIPKIAIFDHFLDPKFDPQNVNFWPKPQKRPFFDPPQIPKILENGPFGENRGFQARFEPQKGGGVGVYPGTPQKGHFWPFLTIFGHFWPFLTPFLGCPRPPKNPPPQDVNPPQKPPWPDRLYLIIGLLGRKFGICAENEDFSAPPQVREMWVNLAAKPVYYQNINILSQKTMNLNKIVFNLTYFLLFLN